MPLDLSRIFAELDNAANGNSSPLMSAGRGSIGSLRSFHLPFIPEEVAASATGGPDGADDDATPDPSAPPAADDDAPPSPLPTGVWSPWRPGGIAD